MNNTAQSIPSATTGSKFRLYTYESCVSFRKTKEAFGGLSNMAAGYPLKINQTRILSSEALYQACRFPTLPNIQKSIINEKSPMTAKMVSKPYRNQSREDWDFVRVKVMRWALRVKLAQNFDKFSDLLLSTGFQPIVEDSKKDDFWGAISSDGRTLSGMNVLGRLLMELREELREKDSSYFLNVEPLTIPDFTLYGQPIERVTASNLKAIKVSVPSMEQSTLFASELATPILEIIPVDPRPIPPALNETAPLLNLTTMPTTVQETEFVVRTSLEENSSSLHSPVIEKPEVRFRAATTKNSFFTNAALHIRSTLITSLKKLDGIVNNTKRRVGNLIAAHR